MSLDDIDPDSWGRAGGQTTVDDGPVEDRAPERKRQQRKQPAPAKRITPVVLKDAILGSSINAGGLRTLQQILRRNTSHDVAIPAAVLEILYHLIEQGYQL